MQASKQASLFDLLNTPSIPLLVDLNELGPKVEHSRRPSIGAITPFRCEGVLMLKMPSARFQAAVNTLVYL